MMKYTCPVCAYDKLPDPPKNHEICPQCSTEFGYDDATTSHEELRRKWIEGGRRWWSKRRFPQS